MILFQLSMTAVVWFSAGTMAASAILLKDWSLGIVAAIGFIVGVWATRFDSKRVRDWVRWS